MNRIIIALTTYPARINGIGRVLDSIMRQTYKADKVVLYLSEEQFSGRKIPIDLSLYDEMGFEVHWHWEDMKSHKKYLYAFEEYPNDYIITIDDDCYYDRHMIEEFIQYKDVFPQCVLARRTHLITAEDDGSIALYEDWWRECIHYIGMPRMDILAVGVGGVLYPPHLLNREVFNIDCIKKYCMYADDIWLKVIELLSGVCVVQVQTRYVDRDNNVFAQEGLYQQHNGNGGNDRQIKKLMEIYTDFNKSGHSLLERIFSTGMIYKDEAQKGKKDDNYRILHEWLERIGQDVDIVVYGAGVTARRIYRLLKKEKAVVRIKCFVVEDTNKNEAIIENIKVLQYTDVEYTNTVCIIALADLNEQFRVSENLRKVGLDEKDIFLLNRQLYRAICECEQAELLY